MRLALEKHDRIQRQLIEQFDGYEIRTEGDAFLIAFDDGTDAFSFCLALQEHLLDAAWPEHLLEQPDARVEVDEFNQLLWAGPRVRMGILRGQAEQSKDPVTGRITFKGSTVHRCVALASAANGGQIVADSETCIHLEVESLDLLYRRRTRNQNSKNPQPLPYPACTPLTCSTCVSI